MSPFVVTIEVNTPFNLGWLGYLLGQPEPADDDSLERDGWLMAKREQSLVPIRRTFLADSQNPDDPAFLIDVSRATPADDIDPEPITLTKVKA